MARPPKDGILLYHLTSLDNLEGIFSTGLLPRSLITKFTDIADEEIIAKRRESNLNGYVPFHFFAGSPFAGAVQKRHSEKSFVFITVKRTFARENNFKILTQHPLSLIDCTPKSYDDGFSSMDWDTMSRREYSDRDCCEICMAECLSSTAIHPSNFFAIYTKSESVKNQVTELKNKILGYPEFHINSNPNIFTP